MVEASHEDQLTSICWLEFQDPDVERAYIEEIAKQNTDRVRIGTKLIGLFVFALIVTILIITPTEEWSFTSLRFVILRGAYAFGFLFVFRLTPSRFLEYVLTFAQTLTACCTFSLNAFRLQRYSIDELPSIAINTVWNSCDNDLAISCRDQFNFLLVIYTQLMFIAFAHVRAKISRVAVCLTMTFCGAIVVLEKRQDGGSSIYFALTFALASSLIWYISLDNERHYRLLWASNRKRAAEALWQQEFLPT